MDSRNPPTHPSQELHDGLILENLFISTIGYDTSKSSRTQPIHSVNNGIVYDNGTILGLHEAWLAQTSMVTLILG